MNGRSASDSRADLIVVGSGVAGLEAALHAAELGAHVFLVTRGEIPSGSSWLAQGGMAAAVGLDDSPALHATDTLMVGAGLNSREAVSILVGEGRGAAQALLDQGVPFERSAQGPDLGLEAGHQRRRILHAGGGATGAMLSAALYDHVHVQPNIHLMPYTPVDELVLEGERVAGIRSGEKVLRARGVLLATGGYAGLWGRSTNPAGNNGTGSYLAWKAGATLADLEFVQFHPTALSLPGAPAYLLSEALRGEGALVVDERGAPVAYPLLPRDVLARAIFRHLRDHGPVFLTMVHLDHGKVWREFPSIASHLQEFGLDLARDRIPVAPAAHYCMGGVRTDTDGRTDVPGLYVAGEAACTGAQGANRLASNSLLECLVFGSRAAQAALDDGIESMAHFAPSRLTEVQGFDEHGSRTPADGDLSRMLDRYLGVERSAAVLQTLLGMLPEPDSDQARPTEALAALATRAALLREESRGAHYRSDFPETDERWQGRILWKRGQVPGFEQVAGGHTGEHYQPMTKDES